MEKMKLKNLAGKNIVVSCSTKTEAETFISELNKLSEVKHKADFNVYKKETCYRVSEHFGCGFNSLADYRKGGYKIINFDDVNLKGNK